MVWPNPAPKLDKLCSSQEAFSVGWDPLQESGLVGSEKVPVTGICSCYMCSSADSDQMSLTIMTFGVCVWWGLVLPCMD